MFGFQNNVIITSRYQFFDKTTPRRSRRERLIEQVMKVGSPPITVVIHVDAGHSSFTTARFQPGDVPRQVRRLVQQYFVLREI
jgi:hypothetical protein